jgi:hypothetical protein
MRKITRAGAVVLAAATATAIALPATSAGAAPRGWDGDDDEDGAGLIEVCNHSGYLFNVFADGPSIRRDDLAGSFDECTHWRPVRAGQYQIGFGLRTASVQNVIIQARFKRNGQVYYKTFSQEGVVTTNVSPGSETRVDLFIPKG